MKRLQINLKLRLELKTALLLSRGYGNGNLNQLTVRNSKGQLILSASSIKGRLRYHASQFVDLLNRHSRKPRGEAVIGELFGNYKQQGALYFEDATLLGFEDDHGFFSEVRSGVKISRRTGSQVKKHLHFYEVIPAGLAFETEIEGAIDSTCKTTLVTLLAAIRLMDKIGSKKSSGLGRIDSHIQTMTYDGSSLTSAEVGAVLEQRMSELFGEVSQ